MAFSNATRLSQHNGNGVTTAFPTGFYFLQDSDILVTLTSSSGVNTVKSLTTDYTVTGALSSAGGTVTMLVAPASGEKLTIERTVSLTQETDYISGDAFPSETHERGLDKAMMAASQASDQIGRAFRIRSSDGNLSEVALVANGILGTTAGGAATIMTGAQVQTLLNLPATVIDQPTKTFADSTARAAATPDFLGQLGVQLNTSTVYIGTSIAAGGWTVYDFSISAGSVGTSNLADGAVTTVKVADSNITAAKLASDAVTTAKILDANVTTAKLADGAVTQAKVAAGAVVQTKQVTYTTRSTHTGSSALIPLDDTVPLVTEGDEIISTTFTPQSAANKVLVYLTIPVAHANYTGVAVVFRGSTCIGVTVMGLYGTGYPTLGSMALSVLDSPGSTAGQVYSVRVGVHSNSSWQFHMNGSTTRFFGGSAAATLTLTEIKA